MGGLSVTLALSIGIFLCLDISATIWRGICSLKLFASKALNAKPGFLLSAMFVGGIMCALAVRVWDVCLSAIIGGGMFAFLVCLSASFSRPTFGRRMKPSNVRSACQRRGDLQGIRG